jgi:DNA-binding transcriptional LysR family regulator
MSMVENGLGIAILAELVLLHNSYRIAIRETDPPYYRRIALALKNKKQRLPGRAMFFGLCDRAPGAV